MILPVGFGSSAGGTPAGAIERSLRFNSADSAYLNRTLSSSGNMKVFTLSFWLKRTALGVINNLFTARNAIGSGAEYFQIKYNANDTISVIGRDSGSVVRCNVSSTAVFRDPGAWAHIVISFNASSTTLNVYANNVVIANSTSIGNVNYGWNNSSLTYHRIGDGALLGEANLNGYMAELYHVDGQALTPSSFGETDSATGVWKPKAFSGTYGTNGFYLKFADNSGTTSTTLGKDSSGNGNNWTPNNFSVTAGAGNDSLVDSPTSYGTDTGAGGEVRGNYCTVNPLDANANVTLSNGNLDIATGSSYGGCRGTIAVSSGKWYWEVTPTSLTGGASIGIWDTSEAIGTNNVGATAKSYAYWNNGQKQNNNTNSAYGASYTTNDVIGVALDLDAGTLVFYKNNSSQGTAFSSLSGNFAPGFGDTAGASSSNLVTNFGQRAFAYTAPSGFKALCTQNLPTPIIGATSTTQANDYMNVVLYTGTGSSLGVTGVGFQPDLVWIKSRSAATDHGWYDAVRGVQLQLESNTTSAETTETTGLTAFGTDGFTVGALAQLNTSSATYVSWNWKANGAGSTNNNGTAKSSSVTVDSSTDTVTWNSHGMSDGQKIGFFASVMPGGLSAGTLYFVRDAATNTFKVAATSGGAAIDITSNGTTVTCHTTLTSTVSANTTSKFSIVTYTGTGSNTTVEHGLDIAPTFIITKRRNGVVAWPCLVKAANNGNGQNGRLNLNETANYADNIEFWNNTSPTSKVFSIGISVGTNASGATMVAYCFAPVDGYSAFGSYTGNGSTDGPFVYLGFRPAYVLIKSSSNAGTEWEIRDDQRLTYNPETELLWANSSSATYATDPYYKCDLLSNGFKLRNTNSASNGSGYTYVYAAFAENPFKYSLAR